MDLIEKIASDSIYSAARTVVSVARGLIAIPLITKELGAGEYGLWTVLVTFVVVARTIGGVHLHGALIRYEERDRSTGQSYADILSLTAALAVLVGGICLVAIVVFDAGALLAAPASTDVDSLLFVTTALVVSEMFYAINVNFPRSTGNIRRYEFVRFGRLLVEIVVLAGVFLTGNGLLGGLIGLTLVNIAANLLLFAHVIYSESVPRPSFGSFRRYLGFGAPMVPKDLSGYILTYADRYLLLYFLAPSAVGVYAVAHGVGTLLERIGSVLNPTMYPTIARAWDEGREADIHDAYQSIFRYYTILAVPAFVGVTVLAEPLLRVVSTEPIARRGAPLVPILGLAFVLRGYETVIEYVLTAAEETSKMAVSTGMAAGVNVVLNVVFIPAFDILGAALTTLVSQFLFTALVYRYSVRHISLPLPTACFTRAAVCAAAMGALLLYVPASLGDFASLVVYPAIGIPVYFASMLSLGGLALDEVTIPLGRE